MKNAKVLEDHFGDNGHVTAGMVLPDMTEKRFNELEEKGLVREATADEVKEGHVHDFQPDDSAADKDGDGKKADEPANKKAAAPANKGV